MENLTFIDIDLIIIRDKYSHFHFGTRVSNTSQPREQSLERIKPMREMRQKSIQEVSALLCDRCGRKASAEEMEFGDFTCIEYVGAYNSIFGDGSHISLDICQYCLKETLGNWLKISPEVL